MRNDETPWSVEQAEQLLAMWMQTKEDGSWRYTVTQIGVEMGRSSRSVIGKLRRLNAPARGNPVRGPSTREKAVAPIVQAGLANPPVVVVRLPRPPRTDIVTTLRPADPCQWLEGDYLPYCQCQAPRRANSPYCAPHHKIAYRPGTELAL